jgi:hypothetical protein
MIRLKAVPTGIAIAAAMALPGCYYPYPAYTPVAVSSSVPASFDASWQAARAAAYDEGVHVTSEDRASGTMRGDKGAFGVLITVAQQANGSVRVQFSVTGPHTAEGSGLQDRLAQAYQRRMGR